MMDKSHCFMNVNDEHEYEQYYDFSKTYEGHPDALEEGKRAPLLKKKVAGETAEAEEDGGWEDVDVEDAGEGSGSSDEEAVDEKKQAPTEESKTETSGYSIISES